MFTSPVNGRCELYIRQGTWKLRSTPENTLEAAPRPLKDAFFDGDHKAREKWRSRSKAVASLNLIFTRLGQASSLKSNRDESDARSAAMHKRFSRLRRCATAASQHELCLSLRVAVVSL